MVPEGWKLRTIGDVGNIITGSTPKTSDKDLYDGPIPFVSPADLGAGRPVKSTKKTLTEKGFSGTRKIRKGSTLFTCIGSTIGKIGLAGVDLATNQQINSVVPHSDHDDAFIYYALAFRARHIAMLAGKQAVPIINKSMFSEQPILTPLLPEQKKIAQILSTWDKAITTTEQLLTNSQQQKKALMQQLLTGKKRLLDENGVRFSGEWVSDKLRNIVGKIYGGGTPSRTNPEYWNGDIPWVTVKDLVTERIGSSQEHISTKGLKESSANLVPAGTVIIATRMALGKAVLSSRDVAINQDLKAISSSKRVCSDFVFYWFLSNSNKIQKMGTGSTVKGIQIEAIKSLNMRVPPSLEEQTKISQVLSSIDQETGVLEQRLKQLKLEKKALMQQLLTGKRRVKVDEEAA